MTAADAQQFEFQTEAKQVLELMTHSVYSNRDIFLRELISNSSDALDKLRFESLQNKELKTTDAPPSIFLKVDREARTLTITDNGIGMTRDEVIEHIGTIAKSGTKKFLEAMKEAQGAPELIGQFGVGFYSVFMVADRVVLETRRPDADDAVRWESAGDGTYTLGAGEKRDHGTTITLHLKPADTEDGLHDYTDEWTLRGIIKTYSDFVSYPVQMNIERDEPERDAEGKVVEGGTSEKVIKLETLNSQKAIWARPRSEVEDDEYEAFYRHVSHDWEGPLHTLVVQVEGGAAYKSVLFFPKKPPMDLYQRDYQTGVKLYVKRVFIKDDCKELLPEYLRFMRGVVDAEELSLNVSREILQQDRQIRAIRKHLVKKIVAEIKRLKTNEPETFKTLWLHFGRVLKEGIYLDADHRDTLLEIALCDTTHEDGQTTLDDYISRMKNGQDAIYTMTGSSKEAALKSPHLEAFLDKGYEVLLFSDPVDEVWLQQTPQYKDVKFVSIGSGEVELGDEEEKKEAKKELEDKAAEYKDLLAGLRKALQDTVKEVRLSARLTSSPACLVGDAGAMSPQLEQMLKSMGQEVPAQKRILELNPNHPMLTKLQAKAATEELEAYAQLLYGQALLAEGGQLEDPAGFVKVLTDVMERSL